MRANRRKWSILHIVNMGTLMTTLDVGIVNVSMPTMAQQFSRSLAQIQWVATAYLLTMVALLPFLGKFSDRWDRRKIYSYGFLVFGIASLCIAISHGLAAMLFARCLQGVGATMIMANSQAMVRQVFPDHERGRALGMNAVIISLGTLSGPAVGGFLLEFVSWPWLFWINVPIGMAAFFLGYSWFPRERSQNARTPFDWIGTFLLAAGIFMLMLSAEATKRSSGFNRTSGLEGAVGLLLFMAFWFYERRITYGILDRELFGLRKIRLGTVSIFLVNLAQTATMIPTTFYLQGSLGLSTGSTGLLLILQPLLMGIVAPFAGWFRDRFGGGFPITMGQLLCSVSMLSIVCFPKVTVVGVCFQLALFGIGNGLFHATNNAEMMSAAPEAKASLTGSLLALARYFGQIAGIGLATLLVGSMGIHMEAAVSVPLRFLFGICFLCCLIATGTGHWSPKISSSGITLRTRR